MQRYGSLVLEFLDPLLSDYFQGSTLTFQPTSQVAGDILDVTTMSVRLPAKLASGNRNPQAKTEFLLGCG